MARFKVLVVEDDFVVLMSSAQVLRDAGLDVIEADSADLAEAVLRDQGDKVAVVFSDIEMPGRLNGLDLARIVKENWPAIMVLLASGRRVPPDSMITDSTRFLGKPYDLTEVSGLICSAVDGALGRA